MKLTVLDEVASTNEVVKNALREGKAEGLIVRARRQSSGYGRQGREWDSPEGGLYMSILLRPDVAGSGLATLSLVVGLSVQRALGQVAAPQFEDGIQVKWPNDVIYMPADCERADEYRKLCGISLEAHGGGVCVGVGVNVLPPAVRPDVGGKNRPAYVSDLAESSAAPGIAVEAVLDAFLEAFATLYCAWQRDGFASLVDEFNTHASLNGQDVRMVDRADNLLAEGSVVRVDTQGRLVLRTEAGVETAVSSGEAHLV